MASLPSSPPVPRPGRRTLHRASVASDTPGSRSSARSSPYPLPSRPSLVTSSRSNREDYDHHQLLSDGVQNSSLVEELDAANEIIMAIEMKDNGTVGCAYYVALDEAVFIQEDIAQADIEFVETLLLNVQPTTLFVSHRSPPRLVEYLERSAHSFNDESNSPHDLRASYVLRSVAAAEFNYDAAKDKLTDLDLAVFDSQSAHITSVAEGQGDTEDVFKQTKSLRLATFIHLDSRLSISCAGAVLNDIGRRKHAEYQPSNSVGLFAFQVKTVHMFTLKDSMFMNADTLSSLQILKAEFHPNSQMRGPDSSRSGTKESLSVFGLIQPFASTSQGKMKLRKIFLRPSLDLGLIHERQATITALLRPENAQKLKDICKMLRKIRNVKIPLLHLHKGVDHPSRDKSIQRGVWLALSSFARYSVELREAVHALGGSTDIPLISKVSTASAPECFNAKSPATFVKGYRSQKGDRYTTISTPEPSFGSVR